MMYVIKKICGYGILVLLISGIMVAISIATAIWWFGPLSIGSGLGVVALVWLAAWLTK